MEKGSIKTDWFPSQYLGIKVNGLAMNWIWTLNKDQSLECLINQVLPSWAFDCRYWLNQSFYIIIQGKVHESSCPTVQRVPSCRWSSFCLGNKTKDPRCWYANVNDAIWLVLEVRWVITYNLIFLLCFCLQSSLQLSSMLVGRIRESFLLNSCEVDQFEVRFIFW